MATSKAHAVLETALTWTDTGGDAALDLGGLSAAAVRAGTLLDLGTGARPYLYEWRMVVDGFDTAPVVGETVDIYLATSDGTNHDGDISGTDGASSTVVLPNLRYLGSCVVQTTTAANELIASGVIEIFADQVAPVVHNNTADALLSTSDAHKFILTPISIQGQAS